MRIRLPDDEGRQLEKLAQAARPEKYVSGSAWVRGAIRVALDDDEVAARIADAAPLAGHGGARPGAGRPPRARGDDEGKREGDNDEEEDDEEEDADR